MSTYTDNNGYERHSNLVHRQKAYEQIYKKNRHKYTRPFSEYVIHHKDGNKRNNNIENLEILLPEEHERIHNIKNGQHSYLGGQIFSNRHELSGIIEIIIMRYFLCFFGLIAFALPFHFISYGYKANDPFWKVQFIIFLIISFIALFPLYFWWQAFRNFFVRRKDNGWKFITLIRDRLIIEIIVVLLLILLIWWIFS